MLAVLSYHSIAISTDGGYLIKIDAVHENNIYYSETCNVVVEIVTGPQAQEHYDADFQICKKYNISNWVYLTKEEIIDNGDFVKIKPLHEVRKQMVHALSIKEIVK